MEVNEQTAPMIAEIICQAYGVPAPTIVWSNGKRGSASTTSDGKCKIHLGRQCWRNLEHTLLHELAHIISYHKIHRMDHKSEFIDTLKSIVISWLGDIEVYDWENEYKTILRASGTQRRHHWER